MRNIAAFDKVIGDITAEIINDLVDCAAGEDCDARMVDENRPNAPKPRFSSYMRNERPASHYYAQRDNDPTRMIRDFHSRAGFCIYVPCFAHDSAEARGLEAFSFSTRQGVPGSVGHSATLIPIEHDGERAVFLVDPTFRQFSYYFREINPSMPGYKLRSLNPQLHDQLITKGYAVLTPENAADYLLCLSKREALPDGFDAYRAMTRYINLETAFAEPLELKLAA